MRAGGATVVPVRGDDRITLRDPDGGQVAELTVLTPEGAPDPGALGTSADAPASVLRGLVAQARGQDFLGELYARGLTPADATCARLFGTVSPPGAEAVFLAQRDAILVVGAPGGRVVDGDVPPSDLHVEVRRAIPRTTAEIELPEPLAEPRLDLRVDAATARSYEVKKGEYIQVLDVQGRQCSDFLAFHHGKLQRGIERGLDATTTRTLMGNAYPMPGLHGKFYDQDMDPLVEVVRDTVGRHDTFGLACTAKYYEDAGYFGHVNCTENFNRVLSPYPIAERKGWPALNFFYNTSFDADLILLADEPWSRPGDYVLLRAMNDLVCSSSACPDDIDPANAWECTDVHVRVYAPENRFSMAIARRVTADAEPELTKETGFHPRTSALTKSFVEYRGYWLPHCFDNEGAQAEYHACRERAVAMDLTPLRKWEILGPDAELLMQTTLTRDVRRLAVGQVSYTALCNETGGMIDDGTVFRLGEDNFRFVGGDPYDGVWLKEQAQRLGLKAFVKPTTDQLHNIAVQGPRSRDILREIVWTPPTQTALEDLRWFRFLVGPHRRLRRHPRRRVAHGLHGRAGLRGVLPPVRRHRGVGRGLRGGRAARHHAARARGPRRGAHRVRAHLRGLRVRRPGRPVRGGHRIRRRPGLDGRGLHRPGRARGSQGASAARARRAGARGQRGRRARGLRLRRASAHRRRHERLPEPPRAQADRPVPHVGPVRRAGHGARDRQARRAAEAHPGDGRALPVLRPGQDSAEGLMAPTTTSSVAVASQGDATAGLRGRS